MTMVTLFLTNEIIIKQKFRIHVLKYIIKLNNIFITAGGSEELKPVLFMTLKYMYYVKHVEIGFVTPKTATDMMYTNMR